jgi:hypothetical protein
MTRWVLVGFLLQLLATGCTGRSDSSPSTPRRSPTLLMRGEAASPVGQAVPPPGVAVSPHLLSATVNVAPGDRLLLTARFAPGTFTPGTTSVQFVLNLEQTPSVAPPAAACCGEYTVDIGVPWGHPDDARVSRLAEGGRYELAGTVPVRLMPDGLDVGLSLSLLGTHAVPRTFRVTASLRVDDDAVSPILDSIPQEGAPPALVGRLESDTVDAVSPVARAAVGGEARPFISEEGSFSVLFPGTPIYDTLTVPTPEGPQVRHVFRYAGSGVVYFMTHACTPPPTLPADSDRALDLGRDSGLQMAGGTLVSEERVVVNGHRGTRLVERDPKGEVSYSLIVIGGQGNYYSLVAGPRSPAATKKALSFLDSFSVLPATSKSWCQRK